MSQPGWIKLHRGITEHWLWDCEFSYAQAWIDLLLKACHKPNKLMIKGQLVELKRGQQARSEVTLSRDWKWSRGKVRRFINQCEKDGMIECKATHLTSIITICNYDSFQGYDTAVGTPNDTACDTSNGQQAVHKQEVNNLISKESCLPAEAGACMQEGNGEESAPLNKQPDNCPHQEIIALWHELMPELTTVKTWNEKRAKMLKARWNGKDMYGNKFNNLKFWRKYFEYIRESDWLMGKTGSGWSATLEWVITESNFNKIIEGTYHNAN